MFSRVMRHLRFVQGTFCENGLSLCLWLDQHLVGDWISSDCDTDEGAKGGMAGVPAVEAKDELVEVGLEMLWP